MSEYDSILKEKKKKVVVQEKEKKFPKFWVSFFLVIIILVVSYIIYFNTFLSAKVIFTYDCLSIFDKYSSLIKNIPLEESKSENNLIGVIQYENDKYDFNLVKNDGNIEFNISNLDKYINYYLIDSKAYVKVSSINEYISLDYIFSINTLFNLDKILGSISEDKFIRNVYFDEGKPIVVVNVSFNTLELNNIFGLGLEDEYEVIATFKNNAVMNNMEEVKIVINNKTKDDRRVVKIIDNNIIYTVGNDTYSTNLEVSDNSFVLKISKNDVLYSILNGNDSGDRYQYNYKVVDEVYNISMFAIKTNDGYLYELNSKKGEVEETMNINVRIDSGYLIDNGIKNFVSSSNQLISDTYKSDINYFKDRLLKFVK